MAYRVFNITITTIKHKGYRLANDKEQTLEVIVRITNWKKKKGAECEMILRFAFS